MEVFEKHPSSALSGYINRYLYIKADREEMSQVNILPTGFSYITRVYGSPSRVEIAEIGRQLPSLFVGGQVTGQKICLYPVEQFWHFGIEFRPAGIYKLFHTSMNNTLNNFADFADLVSDEEYNTLFRVFSEQYGFEEQCDRLNQYFEQKKKAAARCPKIDQVIQLLNEGKGDISIKETAERVYLSARQLRRTFKKICGITPQAYQNIVQMNQIYEFINEGKEAKLQDLAYQCGYFDVAHFINSFKQRMGENPSVYLEADESFINTYIKHTRR